MKHIRPLFASVSASLLLAALLVALPASARELRMSIGVVQGTVDISPLCPTEPCSVKGNPYAAYKVTLVDQNGFQYTLPIKKNGGFSGFVKPGTYTINISPNNWQPVCSAEGICGGSVGSANVPADFAVLKNQFNTFDIIINTGIL